MTNLASDGLTATSIPLWRYLIKVNISFWKTILYMNNFEKNIIREELQKTFALHWCSNVTNNTFGYMNFKNRWLQIFIPVFKAQSRCLLTNALSFCFPRNLPWPNLFVLDQNILSHTPFWRPYIYRLLYWRHLVMSFWADDSELNYMDQFKKHFWDACPFLL